MGKIIDFDFKVISDDEAVLVVCNPIDASYLLSKDKNFLDALLITSAVPEGELTVIPKEEFLDYLYERNK